jgi:hypothetical protein
VPGRLLENGLQRFVRPVAVSQQPEEKGAQGTGLLTIDVSQSVDGLAFARFR